MSEKAFNQSVNERFSIENARQLAFKLHQGQKDHSGQDYILHPERVVNNVTKMFPNADEETIIAAWLHDTIEDCFINDKQVDQEYLKQQGVPKKSIKMIDLVTKPVGDTRKYDEVIDDLAKTGNVGAIMVKIADNGDNLHPKRVEELFRSQMEKDEPGKAKRLNDRYHSSIKTLSKVLGINPEVIFTIIKSSPQLKTAFTI